MSNSKLVVYTKLSPNCNKPRNHAIDTISIHCVVGQLSAESICGCFTSPDREASCNYGIGYDGRISLCVEEKNRSWCTSSSANDHRAITIEVASDKTHPYAVTDKAYAALIDLCADICQRNGIKKLLWKADKSLIGQPDKQNLTVHRWFANKSCPGDYLYNLHGKIADEVNKRLGAGPEKPAPGVLYRVQTGAFGRKDYAERLAAELKAKGFDTYLAQAGGYYKVQVGAYAQKSNADTTAAKLKAAGYDTYITTSGGAPVVPSAPVITKGCKVRVNSGAKTYTGGGLASFVYKTVYDVIQVDGARVVIGIGKSVTAAMNIADLKKV